jgi:hypothetical protein
VKIFFQKQFIIILFIVFNFENIKAQGVDDNLSGKFKNELSNARMLTRPSNDGTVVVYAAFHLQDIDKIDDETETFQFAGYLSLTWQDSRQSFAPLKEGVSEKVYQGNFQFNELSPAWYPQVDLVNTYGVIEKQAVQLSVQPNGTCVLIESINATAKTRMDFQRYPFDDQSLQAFFKILGYKNNEVVFTTDSSLITWDRETIRVPQWQVKNVSASVQNIKTPYSSINDSSSAFVLVIDAKRESLFMMRLVVIPLSLIAILSWSVFWMDKSSLGDRMSVSFVGILTAVTYQVVVSGILPKISDTTMIHAFLNISMIMMCCTVVINLIVGALDRKGQSKYGDTLDWHSRWAFPAGYAVMN